MGKYPRGIIHLSIIGNNVYGDPIYCAPDVRTISDSLPSSIHTIALSFKNNNPLKEERFHFDSLQEFVNSLKKNITTLDLSDIDFVRENDVPVQLSR